MEIVILLTAIVLIFGKQKEAQSKLPPFTKNEAEQYWKNFNDWNRR